MEIICYACGKGEQPENSLEGIQNCQNVDTNLRIEMDVQLTQDNQVVLFHDPNTLRTTGVNRLIAEQTLAQLEKLNVGHQFQSEHQLPISQIKIPTLQEVLSSFPKIRLVLDLSTADQKIVENVYKILKDHDFMNDIIIVSMHDYLLKTVKKAMPSTEIAAGATEAKKLLISSMFRCEGLFPLTADYLMLPEYYGSIKVLSPRIISHTHQRKKKIFVWKKEAPSPTLVDTIDDFLYYQDLGIDVYLQVDQV